MKLLKSILTAFFGIAFLLLGILIILIEEPFYGVAAIAVGVLIFPTTFSILTTKP